MTGKYFTIFITFLCVGLLGACSEKKVQSNENPLARVYEKYLYPSDIKNLIAENTSSEDSAKIVDEFIDNWIRHNLILKISEDNLQSRLPEIDQQAKEYRESLVIYAYEKQWLAERLDTVLHEDSLLSYYEKNPQEFILKQDIFRMSYAIVDKNITSYDSLRSWFVKDIDKFRNELEVFCLNNCKEYIFEPQNWFSEDALFKILPLPLFENNKMRTQGIVEYTDETNKYIVKVHAFNTVGTAAPFAYIKDDVQQIIIGKRKMEMLKKNYHDMYSESMKRGQAEIYSKN